MLSASQQAAGVVSIFYQLLSSRFQSHFFSCVYLVIHNLLQFRLQSGHLPLNLL